jgi:hypothetical protein
MNSDALASAADAVFRTSATAMRGALRQVDREETQIPDVVANAHQLTDELALEIVSIGPAAERPVCCAGCTACCHLHVVATPPEVIAMAAYVERHLDAGARQRLGRRIETHIEATRGLDGAGRRSLRTACPLLEDGRCTAYAVRPITCRGWNSLDRSVCDADLKDPARGIQAPLNLGQFVLASRVTEGIRAACHSSGLEHRLLDLPRALTIALGDLQGAMRGWLASSNVFESAVSSTVHPAATDLAENRERSRLWGLLDQGPEKER